MATAEASIRTVEGITFRLPVTLLQRHEYSVIDVAVSIHDAVVGSGDGIPPEKARELVEWLHWRVNYAWSQESRSLGCFYDEAVRLLALSAIDLAYHPEMGLIDPSERPD